MAGKTTGRLERTAASSLPVAGVLVEVALPAHLDRVFDYLLPERLDAAA